MWSHHHEWKAKRTKIIYYGLKWQASDCWGFCLSTSWKTIFASRQCHTPRPFSTASKQVFTYRATSEAVSTSYDSFSDLLRPSTTRVKMSEEQLSSDFHKIQRFAQELKRPDSVITTSSIVSSSDTASQAGDSEGPPSAYTISGLYGLPPGLPGGGQQPASMQQPQQSNGAAVAKVVSRRRTHSGSLGLESHGGGHVMSNPNGKYLTWMKKGLWGAKLGLVKLGAKKWICWSFPQ